MDVDFALRSRWDEYERLRSAGELFSAVVRLAEIANFVHYQPRGQAKAEWENILREERLSGEDVAKTVRGFRDAVERLRRILGIGVAFEYEELVLAITLRVQLDLVAEFLRGRGLGETFTRDGDLAAIDERMVEIARSKRNAASFLSAQRSARKNWGVPLHTRWLSP